MYLKMQLSFEELIEAIKHHIEARQYVMDDFWNACGKKASALLARNKANEIKTVRQIGMAWACLSGMTCSSAGRLFNRNHSTVLHALKVVYIALENPKQYPDVMEIIEKIYDFSWEYPGVTNSPESASALNLELHAAKFNREKFN